MRCEAVGRMPPNAPVGAPPPPLGCGAHEGLRLDERSVMARRRLVGEKGEGSAWPKLLAKGALGVGSISPSETPAGRFGGLRSIRRGSRAAAALPPTSGMGDGGSAIGEIVAAVEPGEMVTVVADKEEVVEEQTPSEEAMADDARLPHRFAMPLAAARTPAWSSWSSSATCCWRLPHCK